MASPMKMKTGSFYSKNKVYPTILARIPDGSEDELMSSGEDDVGDDDYIPGSSIGEDDDTEWDSLSENELDGQEEDQINDGLEDEDNSKSTETLSASPPPSTSVKSQPKVLKAKKKEKKWYKKKAFHPQVPKQNFTKSIPQLKTDTHGLTNLSPPQEFFRLFFTEELFNNIVFQTNLYIEQHQTNSGGRRLVKPITKLEMLRFWGVCFYMSYVQIPHRRMYWAAMTKQVCVTNVLPRVRFEEILHNLHFNDNSLEPPSKDDPLYKIRPFIDALQEKFLETVHPEPVHSVDEMMVPFKGRHKDKKYMPSKPTKWGYKFWARCGISGYVYEMEFVSGPDPGLPVSAATADPCMIKPSCVVIRLTEKLPPGHTIAFDNLFNSIELLEFLTEQGHQAIGTLRSNRTRGCQLKSEKDLKTEGRGSFDSRVDETQSIIVCNWYDNRVVTLASNYADVVPISTCIRRNKREKLMVKRPNIVAEYNATMGGTDLSDMFISLYRTLIKTRKWYLRLVFHYMDIAVVNSWVIYRSLEGGMPLLKFKEAIANSFLHCPGYNETDSPVDEEELQMDLGPPPDKRKVTVRGDSVHKSLRYDGLNHLARRDSNAWGQRCKGPSCLKKTKFFCTKCKVHLCIGVEKNNCFEKFHKK